MATSPARRITTIKTRPEYEVATLLWFDQHLKGTFTFPKTPESALKLDAADGVPTFTVEPDRSKPILSVDVFYTQHGKPDEEPEDRENTMHRFWHHAPATEANGRLDGEAADIQHGQTALGLRQCPVSTRRRR